MTLVSSALAAGAANVRPAGAAAPAAAIISQTVSASDGAAPPAPAAPADPLAAMVSWAASRQDSLAPLLANLTALANAPNLPPGVAATASQLLAVLTPLDGEVTADELRAAVQNSGVFLENTLAALSQAPEDDASGLQQDLKALLLRLVGDLPQSAAAPRATDARPQPPLAGQTSGQAASAATLGAGSSPQAVAHALSQQAQAALARVQLSQAASLRGADQAHWMFEIPVATPDGTAIAQFEISRDGRGGGSGAEADGGWRARFSVNAAPSGPVHAEVALAGDRTRVTLMAPDEAARAALAAGQDELTAALGAEHGGDVAVRVMAGAPASVPPPPGQFVDQSS